MFDQVITRIKPPGFVWEAQDPFLFCLHHPDDFPAGNENMGPLASQSGRMIGQDFTIPGFPSHPDHQDGGKCGMDYLLVFNC
jgi:quercetin 2,3-dioxygenase